jgi:hypothetical protein
LARRTDTAQTFGSFPQPMRKQMEGGPMPLTMKGSKIMSAMKSEYGDKKGESVFYASRNKGTIKGVEGKTRRHKVKYPSPKKPK